MHTSSSRLTTLTHLLHDKLWHHLHHDPVLLHLDGASEHIHEEEPVGFIATIDVPSLTVNLGGRTEAANGVAWTHCTVHCMEVPVEPEDGRQRSEQKRRKKDSG